MTKIKWFAVIRAYGLFLVLGYHLFYNIFPAGFLGVDIFFTFSGFLVTALAINEVHQSGEFSLLRFCKRRAKRIVIPLYFAVIFTLPLLLLISPDFSVGIAKQTAAALSFTTNWFHIMTGSSYEAQLLPSYYIHTWSLAIEMQFYISWGLLCTLISAGAKLFFSENSNSRYKFFKFSILFISGSLAVLSYLYMEKMYNTGSSLDAIYFNTFARFFPFFTGAFAASIWGVQDKQYLIEKSRSGRGKPLTFGILLITFITAAYILLI